jgi:Tfp pilus assembly protein PilN
MDPSVSASFIPKKPLEEVRSSRGGAAGLVFLLILLIFIGSLIAAGSAFLYGRYLSISLDNKKASLEKYQEQFEISTIQTLVRFDSRVNEAQTILQKHLAPSSIFAFISQNTLEKVRFRQFTFTIGDGAKGPSIQLQGVADSFATVALQSDKLGNSKVLKDVIFSGISIEDAGKVAFSVTATLDPSFILYSNNLGTNQQLVPVGSSTPSSQ